MGALLGGRANSKASALRLVLGPDVFSPSCGSGLGIQRDGTVRETPDPCHVECAEV